VTRNVLVRAATGSLVLYAVAFLALALGGARRSDFTVAIAAVFLLGAGSLVQLTLTRARRERLLPRLRRWLPRLAMAVGALLVAYWVLRLRVGNPTAGWGLCGVCTSYLGIGLALTEIRAQEAHGLKLGIWLTTASAVAFVLGLELALHLSLLWALLAVVALLSVPAGITLLSERLVTGPPRALRLGLVLGPIVGVSGTLLLVLWTGIPSSFAWALTGVLFVLLGAIASNTQVDVLLVVTVLTLVWATAPHGVGDDESVAPRPGKRAMVSLGDSYMSGEGSQRFFSETNHAGVNECRRSPKAYVRRVVKDRRSSLHRLGFFACSGALTENIFDHDYPQYPGEPVGTTAERGSVQLEQLQSLIRKGVDVRLIIISIGGNDASFAEIGSGCLAPGSCVERGQTWLQDLAEVSRRVDRTYAELAKVAPDVPVVAVPYPQPISETACAYSQLGQDEHKFLNGFVNELDRLIKTSARNARFYYLGGMRNALGARGLRICDGVPEEMGVNFIALKSIDGVVDQRLFPSKWIHNSLHPNEKGHKAMAGVLRRWMAKHHDPPNRTPRRPPESFAPVSLGDLMGSDRVAYCGQPGPDPRYCDRGDNAWAMTQVLLLIHEAALPLLLVVFGCLLFWLPVLVRTRPLWAWVGDQLQRLALGLPGLRSLR
jgi:lysophospholipase L1-like esterase